MSQNQRATRTTLLQQGQELSATQEEAEYYTPYPPADLVREYEEILPGSAERILALTEQAQVKQDEIANFQMSETRKINDANIANQKHNQKLFVWGLYLGTCFGLCVLGVIIYAIYKDSTKIGIAAFTALGVVLAIYILRSSLERLTK